jgi:4'-phosphopantetheinyl transferase
MEPSRDSLWARPQRPLLLSDDEVHVWRAALDPPASGTDAFMDLLAEDECHRASQFRFQQDRNRFIVARGVLRMILSSYLGQAPGALRFCYGTHGKPALLGSPDEQAISFNVSHAHRLALFAITRQREVGLDIEYVRADLASEQIAEQFFSIREVATLRQLPAEAGVRAFFNCWTRKEAYLKALSVGLALRLDQFDVSLAPGEPAALVCDRQHLRAAEKWAMRELYPGHGYVAAAVAKGHNWRLACWQWEHELMV